MDDFEKLLAQLKADDPFYNLSSLERKQLRAHIQAMQQFFAETTERREELWVEIESAPPDSPWHKKLVDELGRVTSDFITRGNIMVAVINEAKRKNREMGGDTHPTPEFTAKVEDTPECQIVRLKFTKFDHAGVYIQCRLNGGAWKFRAVATITPYVDAAPLRVANTPETREYRMRFWDKDEPNGDWTAVTKVTVGA